MLFATLVFISAFLIESIGSYISIVGLSALFSTNPVIIALALSLDIAKIITVSFLYKKWEKINKAMKIYMTIAAAILMVITSSGAAGYLSAEFQKAILPTKGSEIVVNSMTEEKTRLEARKVEIDKQIAQLPPENVKGRQKLQKQFAGELEHINSRIIEIDQELPKLQLQQVDVNAHAGPILYVAQAFDTTVESAVKYVILLIIFVFDPLAVALIIAGNFLLEQLKKEKTDELEDRLAELQREVNNIEKEIDHSKVLEQVTEEIIEEIRAERAHEVVEPEVDIDPIDNIKLVRAKIARDDVIEDPQPQSEPEEVISEEEQKFYDSLSPEVNAIIEDAVASLHDESDSLTIPEQEPVSEQQPKKKRGRKKKDESEPKPSIVTEEQLTSFAEEEVTALPEEVIESVENLPVIEELTEESEQVEQDDTPISHDNHEVIFLSDLNRIQHDHADVTFVKPDETEGEWRPAKKVLNIYNK